MAAAEIRTAAVPLLARPGRPVRRASPAASSALTAVRASSEPRRAGIRARYGEARSVVANHWSS